MKASEKLLKLDGHRLEVFKNQLGICVFYQNGDVLDYPCRKGEFGIGNSFEDACEDYFNKISGKKLVFGYGKNREEIIVL